jgi:hypothetical protein
MRQRGVGVSLSLCHVLRLRLNIAGCATGVVPQCAVHAVQYSTTLPSHQITKVGPPAKF